MRWSIGYFGVKDLFTIVNAMGGVFGIYFSATGRPDLGAWSIFAGYLFGDALDGPVARLTKTGNKFGSEFDSAADHLGQGIAPAVVTFSAFNLAGYRTLGVVLMSLLCVAALIRMARFNTGEFNYPSAYCGLPRTISGLLAATLPNSFAFTEGYIPVPVAAGLIGLAGLMGLMPIPYLTHKGRKLQRWIIWILILAISAIIGAFFAYRQLGFDAIALSALLYITLSPWIVLSKQERAEFRAEYKRWAGEVAQAR